MNKLILANPGTGKTTTLANRVIELLKDGADPKDILCITFTEKAAKEMSQRIREFAEKARLDAKLHELSIHTFHSYALSYLEDNLGEYQVLGNNAIRYSIFKSFETNKALNYPAGYIIGDIVPKVENAIRYLKSYGIIPEEVDLERCNSEISRIYNERGIESITIKEQLKFAEYFLSAFKDYERSKKDSQIDYNDMLLKFVKLKEKKRFRFVLVDELQDVNGLEAEIAMQSGEELFLVGDRKQSIFGFQGGSVRNFRIMEERLTPVKEKLLTNHRSAKSIISYAGEHFRTRTANGEHAEELEGFTSDKSEEGSVEIIETAKGQQEKLAVKKALELQDGKTTAIITRSNGQILAVSRMLDSKGVRYSTTISNATSEEAKNSILAFLKGLLYDEKAVIVNALFTPFAGTSLKEAFEVSRLYNERKLDDAALQKKAASFMELRRSAFSRESLVRAFDEVVLPISVSIGRDYYITAAAIRKNIMEFFDMIDTPVISDLFNYLQVTEESYEPIGKQENLVITTVHKSKGLEFDNVIYIPKSAKNSFSFIDAVVYGIIKGMKDIDIAEELEEEHLRVDFVAFTRARNSLFIIANSSNGSDYAVGKYGITRYETMEDEPEPISRKFDEAYGLFVNKRYEEAKKAIEAKDPWLREYIDDYFAKKTRLSYTMIEGIGNPFSFLKSNIMGLREESPALDTGNMAHRLAEERFKGTLDEKVLAPGQLPFLDNIKKLDSEIRSRLGGSQISAEEEILLLLKDLIPAAPKEMEFKAKIDAVYKTNTGYLIVDWKTDKTDEKASEHRRQLATYIKLYSIANRIDEKQVECALGFIALRGKINTGELGCRIDAQQPQPRQYDTVIKHINRFLEYRKNPELFINAIKEQQDQEALHRLVKQNLED